MLRAASLTEGGPALEASLLLTDDATIRTLNKSCRRKDKPTDVLAFALREGSGPVPPGLLGDVVISVDTARRQARKGLEAELVHLAAHGGGDFNGIVEIGADAMQSGEHANLGIGQGAVGRRRDS